MSLPGERKTMSEKLKVLHLCSARQFVGEAARVLDICERMIENGHLAEIVARKSYSVAELASRRGLPYTNSQMQSRFNPFIDFKDVRIIRKRIEIFQPHIVHAHRGKDHWLAAMALNGMREKIPLIRTRHVVTRIKPHIANKWLFKKATKGLICVSQSVMDEVNNVESIVECPVRKITGGINQKRFVSSDQEKIDKIKKYWHIKEEAPVISCLARLAPVKGQEHILNAVPEVISKYPDAIFLFAFPRKSDYRNKLEQIVEAKRIRPHVRFLGSPDQLSAFLQMSDIGLLSSIGSEGWSRATVEFMYFGVPVIASDVGCISEIIDDGVNGFVVPPKSPEKIADRIINLLDDSEKRKKMGELAREKILAKHTLQHTVDELLQFYCEILQQHGIDI
jgi:glycosyltransferase involved in cell wall biosynthesis